MKRKAKSPMPTPSPALSPAVKNTSVALGDALNTFIARQVGSGRYGSASEVVRAGLRLLEIEEAKMEALRAALEQGAQSPIASDSGLEGILAEIQRAPGK